MFKGQTSFEKPQSGVDEISRDPHGAVSWENIDGCGRFVIVCEHASNHIPPQFQNLGLSPDELERHIAWDPGALGVSRALARRLDAALVFCNISRLIIDCNRDPAMTDAMPTTSEDTVIPGNQAIAAADHAWRVAEVYKPFHHALAEVLVKKRSQAPVALIGMHSFTPVYNGNARPWHVGILFDRDLSLASPLLSALRADASLVVGENQPYSPGDRVYHTLDRHAQALGQSSVMIEIRNDLLATSQAQAAWGERLGAIIAAV
jgi:predicted N-formylglutamate amidohydrolase